MPWEKKQKLIYIFKLNTGTTSCCLPISIWYSSRTLLDIHQELARKRLLFGRESDFILNEVPLDVRMLMLLRLLICAFHYIQCISKQGVFIHIHMERIYHLLLLLWDTGVAANAMSELNGKEMQYMSFLGATLRTQ